MVEQFEQGRPGAGNFAGPNSLFQEAYQPGFNPGSSGPPGAFPQGEQGYIPVPPMNYSGEYNGPPGFAQGNGFNGGPGFEGANQWGNGFNGGPGFEGANNGSTGFNGGPGFAGANNWGNGVNGGPGFEGANNWGNGSNGGPGFEGANNGSNGFNGGPGFAGANNWGNGSSGGPGFEGGNNWGNGSNGGSGFEGGNNWGSGSNGAPACEGANNWGNGSNGAPGFEGGTTNGGAEGQGQFGNHGQGHHHNMLAELGHELTGSNALTSSEQQSIQQIVQQGMQGEKSTMQDLQLQKATLVYDVATGNSSGAQTTEQAIASDQSTLLTNRTNDMQQIFGALSQGQQQALTSDLTNRQQQLSANSPQSGTPQDLMLQNVNLELAVAKGDTSGEQSAQQAIASDQSTMLSNRVNDMQQRFASLENSNPNAMQQITGNLQNRVTELSNGNNSSSSSTATTDATLV